MKKRLCILTLSLLLLFALALTTLAHSGRTDSGGGHRDNKNKSGLGYYHYHCGGYPPHLHPGGVCPYTSSNTSYSSSPSVPKTVYASSVTLSNLPQTMHPGDTQTIIAAVSPSNAQDKDVTWLSSDPDIVSVSSTGKLTAIDIGKAVITAKTSRGTSKTVTITVKEIPATAIETTDAVSLFADEETTLTCTFTPENTTYKTLTWTSADETIATVDENGKVTAVSVGVTTITATHKDLTDTTTIEVKPVEVKAVTITCPEDAEVDDDALPQIKKGSALQLSATVEPQNATYKNVTWSTSDETIATVDNSGLVTAYESGTVTVTATAENGVTDKITLEISISDGALLLGLGGVAALAAGTTLYIKKKKQ